MLLIASISAQEAEEEFNVIMSLSNFINFLIGGLYAECNEYGCDYYIYDECTIECSECLCESELTTLPFLKGIKLFFSNIWEDLKNLFGFGGREKTEIEVSEEVDEIPKDESDTCRKVCKYVGNDCPDDKWTMRCFLDCDELMDFVDCDGGKTPLLREDGTEMTREEVKSWLLRQINRFESYYKPLDPKTKGNLKFFDSEEFVEKGIKKKIRWYINPDSSTGGRTLGDPIDIHGDFWKFINGKWVK